MNTKCQDCGEQILEDEFPYPVSCSECLEGRRANDEYDEWVQRELDRA